MLSCYLCAQACPTLQTRCAVIQLTINKARRVSVSVECCINFDGISSNVTYVIQFLKDHSVLESFWLSASHLHFDKGLQFCFMEAF